jgi:hypothetical protein
MARIFVAPSGTPAVANLDAITREDGSVKGPWTEVRVNAIPPGDPEAKVDSEYKRLMASGMNHNEALAHLRAKRLTQE